ncbi:MAG: hypothetical protein J6R59_10495 [Paludibacteraceae bacterium]|nr:hypothetical protein [Paludibacteraceae bacterium]
MTDRERLQLVLDNCSSENIETIFQCFLDNFEDNLSPRTIHSLYKIIGFSLDHKFEKLDEVRWVSKERATYLRKYLDGSMWKDEEIAKKYLQPQIENAQAIIDACKGV